MIVLLTLSWGGVGDSRLYNINHSRNIACVHPETRRVMCYAYK